MLVINKVRSQNYYFEFLSIKLLFQFLIHWVVFFDNAYTRSIFYFIVLFLKKSNQKSYFKYLYLNFTVFNSLELQIICFSFLKSKMKFLLHPSKTSQIRAALRNQFAQALALFSNICESLSHNFLQIPHLISHLKIPLKNSTSY